MPNLTIYVDAELAAAVRRHEIPISATCQAALRRKARMKERRTATKPPPSDLGAPGARGSVRVGKWRS